MPTSKLSQDGLGQFLVCFYTYFVIQMIALINFFPKFFSEINVPPVTINETSFFALSARYAAILSKPRTRGKLKGVVECCIIADWNHNGIYSSNPECIEFIITLFFSLVKPKSSGLKILGKKGFISNVYRITQKWIFQWLDDTSKQRKKKTT